jgi:hypothetical protein
MNKEGVSNAINACLDAANALETLEATPKPPAQLNFSLDEQTLRPFGDEIMMWYVAGDINGTVYYPTKIVAEAAARLQGKGYESVYYKQGYVE